MATEVVETEAVAPEVGESIATNRTAWSIASYPQFFVFVAVAIANPAGVSDIMVSSIHAIFTLLKIKSRA